MTLLRKYQSGGACTTDTCVATDALQALYDNSATLPRKVVDLQWSLVDQMGRSDDAAKLWKVAGAKTLTEHMGKSGLSACMWTAGMGYQCQPESKNWSKQPFESTYKFLNAVQKGTIPFSVVRTAKSQADLQGDLQKGDIVIAKGPNISHAVTFSHFREDNVPIFIDSNGSERDINWNQGIGSWMTPANTTLSLLRFDPTKQHARETEELEAAARLEEQATATTAQNFRGGGSFKYMYK